MCGKKRVKGMEAFMVRMLSPPHTRPDQCISKCSPPPTAAAAAGNLLDMQQPRPPESLRAVPLVCVLTSPLGVSEGHGSLVIVSLDSLLLPRMKTSH